MKRSAQVDRCDLDRDATVGAASRFEAGWWQKGRVGTHSWMNGYGKLRRRTERAKAAVDFYLFLAAALVVVRLLIHRARTRYRWPTRPTARRLK